MTGADDKLVVPPLVQAVLHHLPDLEGYLRDRLVLHVTIGRSYRVTERGPVVTLAFTCDPQSDTLRADERRVGVALRDHFIDRGFYVGGEGRTITLTGYFGRAIPEAAPTGDQRAA